MQQQDIYKSENVWKVLMKTAPPVMLAQLILSMYNIVDSYFVGSYSGDGLTALSVIFPMQLIITALAVGTGVGVNTLVAHYNGQNRHEDAKNTAGTGAVLAVLSWIVMAAVSLFLMRPFAELSSDSTQVAELTIIYGNIVCVGSLPVFLEGCWTKIHQAKGNMRLPMLAQIAGAAVNIILDPLLIFGVGPFPELGIAGAAIATVLGQTVAAIITASAHCAAPKPRLMAAYAKNIYKLGFPSILMQALYTVYILALNLILAGFGDEAVTALGLYYKLQTFFFIPIYGLEASMVPFLSYNFAREDYGKCRQIMSACAIICAVCMAAATACFELFPGQLIRVFSQNDEVLRIGINAFRIIALSFLPGTLSWLPPVFFQAIGSGFCSSMLSLLRQVFCLVPIFWLLSLLGLDFCWFSFPLSELISGVWGWMLYKKQLRRWGV